MSWRGEKAGEIFYRSCEMSLRLFKNMHATIRKVVTDCRPVFVLQQIDHVLQLFITDSDNSLFLPHMF